MPKLKLIWKLDLLWGGYTRDTEPPTRPPGLESSCPRNLNINLLSNTIATHRNYMILTAASISPQQFTSPPSVGAGRCWQVQFQISKFSPLDLHVRGEMEMEMVPIHRQAHPSHQHYIWPCLQLHQYCLHMEHLQSSLLSQHPRRSHEGHSILTFINLSDWFSQGRVALSSHALGDCRGWNPSTFWRVSAVVCCHEEIGEVGIRPFTCQSLKWRFVWYVIRVQYHNPLFLLLILLFFSQEISMPSISL